MNLLLLDTSTEVLEMGLVPGGQLDRLAVFRQKTGLKHAEAILPGVQNLLEQTGLAKHQLTAVACSLGPGSFTGLRIGLSTAKGLAEGLGVPLYGLSALQAMAWEARDFRGVVVPVIDARKQKFYCGLWQDGQLLSPGLLDLSPADLAGRLDPAVPVLFTGYQGDLLFRSLPQPSPLWSVRTLDQGWTRGLAVQALEAATRGQPLAPDAGPLYLRKSEAEENLLAPQGNKP